MKKWSKHDSQLVFQLGNSWTKYAGLCRNLLGNNTDKQAWMRHYKLFNFKIVWRLIGLGYFGIYLRVWSTYHRQLISHIHQITFFLRRTVEHRRERGQGGPAQSPPPWRNVKFEIYWELLAQKVFQQNKKRSQNQTNIGLYNWHQTRQWSCFSIGIMGKSNRLALRFHRQK